METRTVTMGQAQDEALVFGVDDDGEFYGETEDGERLEIAEPANEPDAWTADELLSECRCIAVLLPGGKAEVNISVSSKNSLCISVYPDGLLGGAPKHFFGDHITETFAQVREWCAAYKDRLRAEAERKLAEAQAAIAALDAEG